MHLDWYSCFVQTILLGCRPFGAHLHRWMLWCTALYLSYVHVGYDYLWRVLNTHLVIYYTLKKEKGTVQCESCVRVVSSVVLFYVGFLVQSYPGACVALLQQLMSCAMYKVWAIYVYLYTWNTTSLTYLLSHMEKRTLPLYLVQVVYFYIYLLFIHYYSGLYPTLPTVHLSIFYVCTIGVTKLAARLFVSICPYSCRICKCKVQERCV